MAKVTHQTLIVGLRHKTSNQTYGY